MRNIKFLIFIVFVINCRTVSYSQKLSAGFYSGTDFSDIHGNDFSGKWKFKPGPSEGIFVDYSINRVLGIKTGIKYSALYYEHIPYIDENIMYDVFSSSSPYDPAFRLIYNPANEMMNFSFLTVPMQLRVSVPSRPKLNLAAGMFYSFLLDNSQTYNHYLSKPEKNDFGYLYSAGISYPLNSDLTGSFDVSYMTGRTEFTENSNWRHGSAGIAVGLAYTGFLKSKKNNFTKTELDSTSDKIYITYKGGINVSWNSCEYFNEKYSLNTGPSFGFTLNFKLGPGSAFQTGLTYERTGYSLKDSSSSFYRYIKDRNPVYILNTKTGIDYIVMPLLLNIYLGKSERYFLNTGPYLGMRLNGRVTGEAYSEYRNQSTYTLTKNVVYDDLEGLIKDNDFGWILGGGITVPVSEKLVLDFGLQYRQGLTDIFDRSHFPEDTPKETKKSVIRNGSLAFQIGLRVPVLK